MKRIILFVTLLSVPFFSVAQDFITDIFSKYSGRDNFTCISINKSLLNLALAFDADCDKLMGKISDIQILVSENEFNEGISFTNEIIENLNKSNFVSLMEIRDGHNKINFYVKKDNEIINHLILLAKEDDEEVFLSLKGKFTLKELAEIGKSSNDHGNFHHLSFLKDIDGN